jgi:hypothetical protein
MTVSARQPDLPQAPLRPPSQVMRLERMGSSFATRLSFMRVLVRELIHGSWTIDRPLFDIGPQGYGTAIYRVAKQDRTYCLVAFSHELAPEMRTDRVIAEAWDATFALFDGNPADADIQRLRRNVPLQEAGRYLSSELVLCRANKSLRYFDHVAERLAGGQQPDEDLTRQVGYLMRTTAVYGNGKFGIADRFRIAGRPELSGPFQAEMLAVYLVRLFTLDLVEHVARRRAPENFVPLDARFRRYIGIGNATGLGMAPFLMTHPALISSWIEARETALARARAAAAIDPVELSGLLERARHHVLQWRVEDRRQQERIEKLESDLEKFASRIDRLKTPDALYRWSEAALGLEAQELVVSLLIEHYPALVDDLAAGMNLDETRTLGSAMRVSDMLRIVDREYSWALDIDCDDPGQRALFWYISEEKLEPRLGNAHAEAGTELERPFAVAHDIQAMRAALKAVVPEERVAEFLMHHPQHRHTVRRVQTVQAHPYGEIRDNLVGTNCLPIDLLRCKLAFFGAAKFDPKSDRWIRIAMYQGAPLPEHLASPAVDDWAFPCL